ncbi:MAG: response regulator, partial [Butyricicoccus sp.]
MIVAICEGDTEQLEELCTYVSQLPDVEQLCFSSGRALLKAIRAGKQFDMILLSIELPDKNGTEIARILRACQPNMDIILISSCPK